MLACMLLTLLPVSCNGLFMEKEKANTAQNNLDLLWTIFDERYCFFEEKNVDWDAMYEMKNRELANFLIEDPHSMNLYFLLSTMLDALKDGHVSLSDGISTASYSGWHAPYPENLDAGRLGGYIGRRARHLNNETSVSILPDAPVGYIRCPSFSEKFNRNDLDDAMKRLEGLKGVIIDVRSNGGGLVSEAYLLASRFAREKTHVGYVRYKTGKGHSDFSNFYPRHVEPGGAHPFHGKVVVLTNRKVYSAANLFVSIMSNLPQACTMGDCTGGGGGLPVTAELYNGWKVGLSTNPVFDTRRHSIEPGLEPDYSIALNGKDYNKDNIIEAAKKWILQP
jgi:hypothetical protein